MSISVVIPVGPLPSHKKYLDECVESVLNQTVKPECIVFVDDMANLLIEKYESSIPVKVWNAPWRLGVASAFNIGVMVSPTECSFMLGADDTLEPDCIERCVDAYQRSKQRDSTYFWTGVRYMDGSGDQYLPCHAAMVTKSLWRRCGGFPPETSVGAPDAALISIFMVHKDSGSYDCVDHTKPLYNYRRHQDTDTAGRGLWQGAILDSRNILAQTWKSPNWCRYE